MKVALLHYAAAPVIGGVERILDAHAQLFRDHGHDVLVISQRGAPGARLKPSSTAAGYEAQLASLLARQDVVIVHNVMTMPFDIPLTEALAETAWKSHGMRFIAWIHDIAAVNPDLAPVPDLLKQTAPNFEYVAVSKLRARQWAGLTGINAAVIPNGIAPAELLGLPESLAAFAEQFGLFDGRPVLLHPTRLLRRKNVEFGFAVVEQLRAAKGTLLVTGADDPHNPASHRYAAWLRSERARLRVEDQVLFVAEYLDIGEAELTGLYRLADALFLPSRQEGFGLPVLEAALHRMPAFLSDIQPLNEFATGHSRRFSLETPPEEVAALILHTLETDLATRARKRALEFHWENIYALHLGPLLSGK